MSSSNTIIDKIIDLLKGNFDGGQFKAYYEGDPLQIPAECLPCISVSKANASVFQDATGMDKIEGQIFIRVMFNKRDDYGAGPDVDLTERKIRQIIEGRDDAGHFAEQSILGVVRPNLTLGSSVVKADIYIEYGIVPRFGPVQETSEGHVTISIEELVLVPNRV